MFLRSVSSLCLVFADSTFSRSCNQKRSADLCFRHQGTRGNQLSKSGRTSLMDTSHRNPRTFDSIGSQSLTESGRVVRTAFISRMRSAFLRASSSFSLTSLSRNCRDSSLISAATEISSFMARYGHTWKRCDTFPAFLIHHRVDSVAGGSLRRVALLDYPRHFTVSIAPVLV